MALIRRYSQREGTGAQPQGKRVAALSELVAAIRTSLLEDGNTG